MEISHLPVARVDDLAEDVPAHAMADGIDLVLVRRAGEVHVFEGRCPHRGALLADGRVEGANLICGVHGWDYRLDTGVSAYNPAERISKFTSHIEDGKVLVEQAQIVAYRERRPERPVASTYDRLFDDPHQDTAEEPYVSEIHRLARNGLAGAHGAVAAMGAPRAELPSWDDLQVLTAQLHRFPAWITSTWTPR
jgi:nitrite reductase/ring-hydroxylating ferredoxin subunit